MSPAGKLQLTGYASGPLRADATGNITATGSSCLNVIDYGADPTGAADSASAFQSAFTAVQTAGYGCVSVPGGKFKLNSQVSITGNTPFGLFGAGLQATSILVNNATGAFSWGGTQASSTPVGVTIRDMEFVNVTGGVSNAAIDIEETASTSAATWLALPSAHLMNLRCRSSTTSAATEKVGLLHCSRQHCWCND